MKNAISSQDVLNSGEDAQNTETSKRSDRKCRLLCDPSNLPRVPYSRPRVLQVREMPRECALQVSDYFRKIHERRKAAYFNRKGAK